MTRELNQLIKKLKALSPGDIARVEQFLAQLKSPERRGAPVELKAVPVETRPVEGKPPADAAPAASRAHPVSVDAEVAHAASAQWRRRPFQAIDANDLQPIAALFREAVDSRAASRIRFGSR